MNASRQEGSLRLFYRAAGVVAGVMVALMIAQIVCYLIQPPPLEGGAAEWFALFGSDPLAGVIGFEGLLVLFSLLSIVVSVALYWRLRDSNPPVALLFLIAALFSSGAFL